MLHIVGPPAIQATRKLAHLGGRINAGPGKRDPPGRVRSDDFGGLHQIRGPRHLFQEMMR